MGFSSKELDLTSTSAVERKLLPVLSRRAALLFCAGKLKGDGDTSDLLQHNLAIACNVSNAVQRRPVTHVVVISSAAIYGEDVRHTRITERTAACPTSYYGMSKFLTEWLFARSVPRDRLLCLRPPFVYGPTDRSSSSPTGFLRAVLGRQPIILWGNGTEKREFLFVEDLASVTTSLLLQQTSGIVNVGTGNPLSFRQVIRVSEQLAGGRAVLRSRPRTKQKVDHLFGQGRLYSLLPNFQPTALQDGLRSCLEQWNIANHLK